MTLRIFNRGAHPLLARLVSELDARGAPVTLDHLLVLDCLLRADYIDTPGAAKALQLTREDARQVLEAMASSQLQLLERRGHTNTATYHLAKEVGTLLKGKAGYCQATSRTDPLTTRDLTPSGFGFLSSGSLDQPAAPAAAPSPERTSPDLRLVLRR